MALSSLQWRWPVVAHIMRAMMTDAERRLRECLSTGLRRLTPRPSTTTYPPPEPSYRSIEEDAVCGVNCADLRAVLDDLDAARREIERLNLIIKIENGHYERMKLCPDHRDKLSGRCIVCDGERRGKHERDEELSRLRARVAELEGR